MLRVDNLNAWYDRSHVLQGVSLQVNKGEIVTLMGRNGAGKNHPTLINGSTIQASR
ncbi:ATP-binding cassette domain-containing protein [Polynucleobacter necessarius]|uniref:ATP-binding cassette domain-containing protein n=1 Tax=Polynucleobacter necessarius TaxID=576610 RepID=UPI002F932987